MSLEIALYSRLIGDTAVTALVGTRIYPGKKPPDAPLPAITYQRISTKDVHSHQGRAGLSRTRMQFNCWAASYAQTKQVARAVRDNFCPPGGLRATIEGVRIGGIVPHDRRDLYEKPQTADDTGSHADSLDFWVWSDD